MYNYILCVKNIFFGEGDRYPWQLFLVTTMCISIYQQGVQLYIWAIDVDHTSPDGTNISLDDDDTIDEFFISITSPVGILTLPTVYYGTNGLATIELNYRVTCAQYYYGENCENLNECELNPVACNGRGQCEDGVDSYTCVCEPQYAGSQCQFLNDCYSSVNSAICSGNGQCWEGAHTGSYTCECDPGYTGMLCDIKQSRLLILFTVL